MSNFTLIGQPNLYKKQTFELTKAFGPNEVPKTIFAKDVVCVPGKQCLYDTSGAVIDCTTPIYIPDNPSADERTRKSAQRTREKFGKYCPSYANFSPLMKVCEEPILFLGHLLPHFGHFLIDGMSRLYAYSRRESRKVLFLVKSNPDDVLKVPHISFILKNLQLRSDSLIFNNELILFKNVEIPFPSIHYCNEIYHTHKSPHEAVTANLHVDRPGHDFHRPIYISRSGPSITRRCENEGALEIKLVERGFALVRPELMTLKQQITMFNNCPVIVGACGSAFHTMLFETNSDIGRRFMFTHPRVDGRYILVDRIKEDSHKSFYLNALTDLVAPGTERPQSRLNVDFCLELLKDCGAFS